MLTLAEDSPDELGEDAAGADLHERSHAARVHRFDLVDEAHRLGELRSQSLADRIRIFRIRVRVGVAVHVDRGRSHVDQGEVREERSARSRDERAVECGGHGETLCGDPLCGERFFDAGDGLRGSRENDLGGGVVVGDHDVCADRGEKGAHFVDGTGNGGHRAGDRGGIAHQLSASS